MDAAMSSTDAIAAWIGVHGLAGVRADDLTWIQTHISHVFLVGDRVYKLRKPVTMPFLDFGTRAQRNADCVREVALNRRLAPDVYLGVVSVRLDGDALEVGGPRDEIVAPECEHAVLMRRLPEGRDALAMLERERLSVDQLERTATCLARFHEQVGLGRPAPWTASEWYDRNVDTVSDSVETIEASGLLTAERVERLRTAVGRAQVGLAPEFERRRLEGRAIDAHGDLHLDHVWFETDGGEPLLVDCLEFDDDLRRIDRAAEVAFLAMDLAYRGRDDLAELFLAAYAADSDDYGLYTVVDYYAAYRALVRAKVAALAATQESVAEEQRRAARESALRHVELAERFLEARDGALITLTCCTVGSGKSSVARGRAREAGGVSISSDRLRKRLAGLDAADRAAEDVDAGLYAPERRNSVYEAMLDRAEPVVASGRRVILDASFSTKTVRDRVRVWAEKRGLKARLLEVRCDPEIARERLAVRERAGRDPSDAGPDFLPVSIDRFESPDEWPAEDHEIVRTDGAPSDWDEERA